MAKGIKIKMDKQGNVNVAQPKPRTTATYRFNAREIATILHALRSMESNLRDDIKDACNESTGCDHFEDLEALDSNQIEVLCARLNPLDAA